MKSLALFAVAAVGCAALSCSGSGKNMTGQGVRPAWQVTAAAGPGAPAPLASRVPLASRARPA